MCKPKATLTELTDNMTQSVVIVSGFSVKQKTRLSAEGGGEKIEKLQSSHVMKLMRNIKIFKQC